MNDNSDISVVDVRILAAMQAVNPPLEKLMTERFALRHEVRQANLELECRQRRVDELRNFREVLIPRYIAFAKVVSLGAAGLTLLALAAAYFFCLFEVKATASLFASLLLPLWLVDQAEQEFGRWEVRLGKSPNFNCRTADC
ncbi:hypothetical protein [Novosphingobium sp. FSW06-99]|uniref:hypothetical protein n=1 Tax=Novosphingobium sp. FSW06-99 TaxID=1739113 RepID=UPI00076C6AFC|nr:hypothetical protein [Novosphingobium sp. FSW06-99]KUR78072.1 hypothetical protein AQZ49_08585 [Novosphingobium sp. FSW06-99]